MQIVYPTATWALTGGPAQPEFSSFTPIGTSDMVDLSSGDMSYNIPLMDVGGYPINIAYNGGVGMDDEASWVGLGWNLSIGQINRNVRGLPDDFKGDQMTYENYIKPNITAGADFQFTPAIIGSNINLSAGGAAIYNNYTGFSIKPSLGIGIDLGNVASVGFNVESGPDGLAVSPNLSIHSTVHKKGNRSDKLGLNFGTSWNSRQGLSHLTMGVSRKRVFNEGKKTEKRTNGSVGSSIGFAEQLYTPSKRVAMQTGNFTVNAALGSEIFGGEGQGQVSGFGTIMSIQPSELVKTVEAFGYNNTEKAGDYDVLDFNREKDGVFSMNSTNLPVTNYTYDVYAVQGQGVGGTFRPFRNQVGYVYDTRVVDGSESGNFGFEVGTGNSAHLGVDAEVANTQSHSAGWKNDNYILDFLEEVQSSDPQYEKVHYKNVGDLSADLEFGLFDKVGNYQPFRVRHEGGKFNRYAVANFDKKNDASGATSNIDGDVVKRTQRQMRNQAILTLTKGEVEAGAGYGPRVGTQNEFPAGAKEYHTAEIQIVRNDGARYVYGLPAYSLKKRETTFAVKGNNADCVTGLVEYEPEKLIGPSGWETLPNDQYFNRITTPAYVHTHLLTSVLSTDYSDREGDGPTPDDFGSYTKFTYKTYREIDQEVNGQITTDEFYRWRVPYQQNMASHNEGLKTEPEDDQANYEYGEKELYLVKTIETKTHVAVFSYSARKDAHGVLDEAGGLDPDQKSYKLDKIDLFSMGEYNQPNATPIKTVHFEYSYSLCPGVPNNSDSQTLTQNELSNHGGKLTLKKIYFTYRNSKMGKYTGYKFNYGEYLVGGAHPDEFTNLSLTLSDLNTAYTGAANSGLNPAYNMRAYDSWGNYLPNAVGCNNTDAPTAPEFNFTGQDKSVQDVRSSVWNLREIRLPSGGTISINYESDDYAYVQDRKVMRMFKVIGAGGSSSASIGTGDDIDNTVASGTLFTNLFANNHKDYIYIQVDGNSSYTAQDYINAIGTAPVQFRFLVNMTPLGGTIGNEDEARFDYVSGYFRVDGSKTAVVHHNLDLDGDSNADESYLALPVILEDKENVLGGGGGEVNPVAKAAWHFARKYLSKHVYSAMPNGVPENDVEANVAQLVSPQVINNLLQVINGPNGYLENRNIGRCFIKEKSWVRLMDAGEEKLGGGYRVSEIRMSDVWEEMNPGVSGYQTMRYGQKYTYETAEGTTSGVATYEPIGNKENPFVQPVFSHVRNLLAPDEENYMEMPFGESFFPNPQVTYSRVSVRNVQAGDTPLGSPEMKKLHKTGYVVTEFYTSKDFPTIVDQTTLDAVEDRQQLVDNLLKLNVRKHFTASQGYVIHLNDMNGKEKSQRVYAEGQDAAISGVDYKYRTHGAPSGFTASGNPDQNKGRLNNLVKVIRPDGTIGFETIGVEVDVVHDLRENQSNSEIVGVNGNLANFLIAAFPVLAPMPIPDYGRTEDRFRSISTTKVINTFGLLEETIAYDAGATVHTKNLAWDQATGEVLVTETVDEFNDKYYTMNYPAHWVYPGMGQAARNIGMEGTIIESGGAFSLFVPFGSTLTSEDLLIAGDEILAIPSDGTSSTGFTPQKLWVAAVGSNIISLMDADGNSYSLPSTPTQATELRFKLIRSGHRNLQSAGIMNVTLMENPLESANSLIGSAYLNSSNWEDWRIINAGGVDYTDQWEVGCECGIQTGEELAFNPFVNNSKGVWRTKSSRTYLAGRNSQSNVTPRMQGFFTQFSPMYKKLTALGDWEQDVTNWTFVAEVSEYSPYGFELENMDALNRHSAAQYGYNNVFPIAVGANTMNSEIGFDGFEDHGPGYNGSCPYSSHFKFSDGELKDTESHSGKYSMKVAPGGRATMKKKLTCTP